MTSQTNQNDCTINKEELKNIIITGDTKLLVEKAEKFGEFLATNKQSPKHPLTPSQIRNFFVTVKKIEGKEFNEEGERELLLLKPKLAYAAKKAGNTKLDDLKEVLTPAIDLVLNVQKTGENGSAEKKKRFKNFCNLFEAILCYHKVYDKSKDENDIIKDKGMEA